MSGADIKFELYAISVLGLSTGRVDHFFTRPNSRCIFYGENISFDASLVIYI